jgi:predicted MFS family arabinose efflux permease
MISPLSSLAPDLKEQLPASAILGLSVASFGSGMSMRVADSMLVKLADTFAINLAMASLVITVFGVAYGFMQFIFGPLGDRYGKYLVIGRACLACACTALLCALAPDFYSLLFTRMFAGATVAAIIPLSMAWIGDVVPYEQRQPVLARFLIGQILGLSSGAFLGGFCADYLSWRVPFILIAISFAVIGFVLLRINKKLPASARVLHIAQGKYLPRLVSEFSLVLKISWARVVLATVMLEGATVFGGMSFIASHLHTHHGVSLSAAGAIVTLFGLGGLLFALRSGIAVSYFGESGLIRFGGLFMTLSLWWWSLPASFCFGLGFYMMHNTLQINATQMAPERRGTAVAAFASSFFLGQSAGVAIGGLVFVLIGSDHLLGLAGLNILLLSSVFLVFHQRHKTLMSSN